MKNRLFRTFGTLAIAAVALVGCAEAEPSATAEEVTAPESPVASLFYDVEQSVQEDTAETDDMITADTVEFDIKDHRAQLKSSPKPEPEPEPEPAPEQQQPEQQVSSPQRQEQSATQQQQSQQPAPRQSQQPQQQQQAPQQQRSRGINGVYNLTTARNYLASYCPGVNIVSVEGSTSYYNRNNRTIMLGTNMRGGENRLYFVLMHELMHHYQGYVYDTAEWNAKLANGTLETEADRMTFEVAPGLVGMGHYTNTKASGAERSRIQQIIQQGRAAGC